jgi:hypothetical protein
MRFASLITTLSLTALLAVAASPALAMEIGPVQVSGKVKSFDEKKIVFENDEAVFEIPRAIAGVATVKSGEEIHLALSPKQADQLKTAPKKTAEATAAKPASKTK